jgi:hypothetical protein
MFKFIKNAFAVIILLCVFTACRVKLVKRPSDYLNTKWFAQEQNIYFTVRPVEVLLQGVAEPAIIPECHGEWIAESKAFNIDVFFGNVPSQTIEIDNASLYEPDESIKIPEMRLFLGDCKFSKNKLVVKVYEVYDEALSYLLDTTITFIREDLPVESEG